MDIEQVRLYALTMPGATEDMPYGPDWLVFRIEGKIFLHIWLEAPEPTCAVKLNPEESTSLKQYYDGIKPAYHLNKVHWNDLYLNTLDDELIQRLIKESYILVRGKLPKRLREKYVLSEEELS